MPLGVERPTTTFGQRLVSYEVCPLLYIVGVIGKYTDVFQEDFFWCGEEGSVGWGYVGGSSYGGTFYGGREFP